MSSYSPVTDADLERARSDPGFRQTLLARNLETLLSEMKRLRQGTAEGDGGARQLREGVELAVRLAELIQNAPPVAGRRQSP
jgi:hypothetical protein